MVSSSRTKIGGKIKQAAGGNWGHPRKYVKKHTNIERVFKEGRHQGTRRKKKKKVRSEYHPFRGYCPFCKEPLDKEDSSKPDWYLDNYSGECRNCGTCLVDHCPACGRSTWMDVNCVYKH